MRESLLRGVLTAGMLAFSIPGTVSAQATNPDYNAMVRQYMSPISLRTILDRNVVPVRILGVEAPDTMSVGEARTFAVRSNIETASLPFRSTWRFGDGTTSSGLVAQHAYDEPGHYQAVVSLENAGGRESRMLRVTVLAAGAN